MEHLERWYYIPPGFEDATTIDQILGESDEGTFTEGGTYIPLDLKVQQQLMVIVQHK